MTQEQNTAGNEALEQESTDDSPVIKALRSQIRDLEKQVKSAPKREDVEAEVREGIARESAISEQLVALGVPAGLSEFLVGKLGDDEATPEWVASQLKSIGFQVEEDDATPEQQGGNPASQSDLARVSNLSAQVATAAQGGAPDDVMQRINAAQTPAELNALMTELGLTAQHI